MLLAIIALIFALGTPHSLLPATHPGLGRDEGVFLDTTADNGGHALYFIADSARHSILPADLQTEQQLNPLWPLREASRDEVLSFPEADPVGNARVGLVTAPPPPPQPDTTTYTLRKGDDLTHVARAYGTTVDDILAANGLSNANKIYAGTSVVIPAGSTLDVASADATPVAADASADDAPTVASADDADVVADVPSADADVPQADSYLVKRGDSAFTIARRFGLNIDDLLAANNISNPNRVYAGQTLTIPAGSS